MVNFSSKGPLRGQTPASGQPPSAAHSCATASSSAIALVLTPASEDAAAAEPARAAPRRSSRARRAPATMTTPWKASELPFWGQSSRQEQALFFKLWRPRLVQTQCSVGVPRDVSGCRNLVGYAAYFFFQFSSVYMAALIGPRVCQGMVETARACALTSHPMRGGEIRPPKSHRDAFIFLLLDSPFRCCHSYSL